MRSLRVRKVVALPGYRLCLTLSNGTVVERDLSAVLVGPVFEPIRADPARFAEVHVEGGSVTWPNGADICPDVLIWGGMPPSDERARPPASLALGAERISP